MNSWVKRYHSEAATERKTGQRKRIENKLKLRSSCFVRWVIVQFSMHHWITSRFWVCGINRKKLQVISKLKILISKFHLIHRFLYYVQEDFHGNGLVHPGKILYKSCIAIKDFCAGEALINTKFILVNVTL